ncbi:MAG: CD1871A family CXXC motif-containing protein [Bacillota bacterium]|nr:CD1871A family CXXC motif-containing protein [Bacillota bacterium]
MRKVSLLLLALGLALAWAGLARGEGGQVLAKAVRICLECIGLG